MKISEVEIGEYFLTVRAKAFGVLETVDVAVSDDGTVRVYDAVAEYFTLCHSLGPGALRRIRALARAVGRP